MKLSSSLQRWLHWFNVPTGLLIALLQRTPVLRVAAAVEEMVAASPAGAVLKSAALAAASLGAVDSLAGATTAQLVTSSGSASGISVTTGTAVVVALSLTGTETATQSWSVTGSFPPGMNYSGLTSSGTINTTNLLLSGTPTTAGAYLVTLTAWQGLNGTGNTHSYFYTITVSSGATSAPTITAQPQSLALTTGGTATFYVGASGNPAPTIQWDKGGVAITGETGSALTLNNVQPSDAGTYTAVVTNSAGTVTSTGAVLTVTASSAPVITSQPQGHTVATGGSVVFSVGATGGGLTYQWTKGGSPISGATSSQYLISNAQASDAAGYTVTVSNGSGAVTSTAAGLTVVNTANPGRLINVSVRIVSGTGANVLFAGFVTGGAGTSGSKQLLIRGIGPTLASYGVPGVMADPILNIIPSGATVPLLTNDNWGGDPTVMSVAAAVGAFALPSTTSKDSALVATLPAGVYSASVSGVNNTTGTVLAEIYDANPSVFSPTTPRLINLSARASMSNDNPLIAGFVIGGSTAKTLMIRAVGPTLGTYGVTGFMSDPQLQLNLPQGTTLTNDNWGGSTLISNLAASLGAFSLDPASLDAVLLVTLDPGVYSAEALGVGGASGVVLVEIYEVP